MSKFMQVGDVLISARKIGQGSGKAAPIVLLVVMLLALGTIARWLLPVLRWVATVDVNGFLDRVMWVLIIAGALGLAIRIVLDVTGGRRAEAAFVARARLIEQERAERAATERIEQERAEALAAWTERHAAEATAPEATEAIEQAAAPVLDLDRAREERRTA